MRMLITILLSMIILGCNDSDGITKQPEAETETIVEKFGKVTVNGSSLIDKNGEVVVLRGMSLFWSQWAPDYYNEETIMWLRDNWKCTVIRIAMGVESGGYLENPNLEYQNVTKVIEACVKLGIYVIVDWHDHHAENHIEASKTFFKNISSSYGHHPNIIYEIYNEPLDVSWVNVLKPYAESLIAEIRSNDSDNLIIVGTPNWSQDVDDVISNPINDVNVAYSLHFYTATHRQWLRDKANAAISSGIPIFVSEWGLSEATGNGEIDIAETNNWADFLESNNLSWCNWSVTNKDETSAILLPSTTAISGWNENELSEGGKIIKDYLIRMNNDIFDLLETN